MPGPLNSSQPYSRLLTCTLALSLVFMSCNCRSAVELSQCVTAKQPLCATSSCSNCHIDSQPISLDPLWHQQLSFHGPAVLCPPGPGPHQPAVCSVPSCNRFVFSTETHRRRDHVMPSPHVLHCVRGNGRGVVVPASPAIRDVSLSETAARTQSTSASLLQKICR